MKERSSLIEWVSNYFF